MAVYLSLAALILALLMLVRGNGAEPRRKAFHLGAGVAFAILAALVMVVSALGSLWLHPLS
jgi:hypothetical protein